MKQILSLEKCKNRKKDMNTDVRVNSVNGAYHSVLNLPLKIAGFSNDFT